MNPFRLTAALAVLLLAGGGAFGRDPQGGGSRGGGGLRSGGVFRGGSSGAAVYQKSRRVSVPRPDRITNPAHILRDNRAVPFPRSDGGGAAITKPAAVAPPAQHAAVVRSASFGRSLQAQQRVEVVPNRYYWHNSGGVRYAHYYRDGVHWYGFYHGPSFYWTRYYGNRWWWRDPHFGRWVYWSGGFWWWPGPLGLQVYVDNAYYPYDPGGVNVVTQEAQPAPEQAPDPAAGSSSTSPDGTRVVQIVGEDGEAYLYDKSSGPPSYLKFLGRGAEKVRFSGGTGGAPLEILLEFKDGGFALYDADGNAKSPAAVAAPSGATPPPGGDQTAPPPPPGGPPQ